MLSEDVKQKLLSLLNGDYRDYSTTEFIQLLEEFSTQYSKDPLRVEHDLELIHAKSREFKKVL